jgi:hypothetical protein
MNANKVDGTTTLGTKTNKLKQGSVNCIRNCMLSIGLTIGLCTYFTYY